jgi:hypothetical protein
VTVQAALADFAATLTRLNDSHVSARGMALPLEDPRDLRNRLEGMCAGLRLRGRTPDVEHANALGAVALALALACARVDELDVSAGDNLGNVA